MDKADLVDYIDMCIWLYHNKFYNYICVGVVVN